MRPGSPNLDPILDKKCIFSYPSSDLASEIHTRFQTWRLRNYFIITLIRTRTKKISRSHISLSFYPRGIETMNTFMHSYKFPREPYRIPDPNGQSLYPFSDQDGARTLPFGAAHAYKAYIREYPPPGFSLFPKKVKAWGLYLQASSLSILAWYREKVGMWPLQMYAAKIKILTFNSCTIRWKFIHRLPSRNYFIRNTLKLIHSSPEEIFEVGVTWKRWWCFHKEFWNTMDPPTSSFDASVPRCPPPA